MGFLDQVRSDFLEIMSDTDAGGGPCEVESPAGATDTLQSLSSDIHLAVDPGTGLLITGRQVTVSFAERHLIDAGFGAICGVQDENEKPWILRLADAVGTVHTMKVVSVHPDRTFGNFLILAEGYSQ